MSDPNFEYFISQRTEVAVVTMVGTLSKDYADQIEECVKAVEALEATIVIFNMRDVVSIRDVFVRSFARMQMSARRKGSMKISGLRPDFRDYLSQHGLIRQTEMSNNLNDAITSIMRIKKSVA